MIIDIEFSTVVRPRSGPDFLAQRDAQQRSLSPHLRLAVLPSLVTH